jgi:hypothetical protein
MFAIFSLIEEFPQIYQIHSHEETCKKSIEELVKRYIIQKRNFDETQPLTIELNEIKNETFSKYPMITYLKSNDKTFDLYEHQLVDKIEKGWVWNGTSKVVHSKKIGYFQIQNVLEKNMIEPEIFAEEITEEQLQMYQDIENMIDEMLSSIEKGNEDLDFEREQIKNLPDYTNTFDLPEHLELNDLLQPERSKLTEIPSLRRTLTPSHSFILKSEPVAIPRATQVSSKQSPIKTMYNIDQDPLQEHIKKMEDEFEKENTKEQAKEQAKEITKDEELEPEPLSRIYEEEPMDLCDIHSDFPKYNWIQRGKGFNTRGGKRNVRRRGAYMPSHGYSFGKLHLY